MTTVITQPRRQERDADTGLTVQQQIARDDDFADMLTRDTVASRRRLLILIAGITAAEVNAVGAVLVWWLG